jgi:hypothetical protein
MGYAGETDSAERPSSRCSLLGSPLPDINLMSTARYVAIGNDRFQPDVSLLQGYVLKRRGPISSSQGQADGILIDAQLNRPRLSARVKAAYDFVFAIPFGA